MTYYAEYDNRLDHSEVIGWYNTGLLTYPNLPAEDSLLELSDEQWANRMTQRWAVDNKTTLVPFNVPPRPPLTIAQQAATRLFDSTVSVVCFDVPEISGEYSINKNIRDNIISIVSAYKADLGLPSQEDKFNYPDKDNNPHYWPGDKFMLFAKAVLIYYYNLEQAASEHRSDLPDGVLNI